LESAGRYSARRFSMKLRSIGTIFCCLVAVHFLTGWSSCEPASIVTDPSFDLWCGNELCAWQTDMGQIRRASTWNRDDYGVEFVGNPAQISQLVDRPVVGCLKFEMLADIDPTVSLTLKMDFQDDGTIEYNQPVSGVDWSPIKYFISAPTWDEKVRFIIEKSGEGHATLAHIRIADGESNCTVEPLALNDRPFGANCESNDQCLSSICAPPWTPVGGFQPWPSNQCAACIDNAACASGMICGLEFTPPMHSFWGCQLPGQKVFGERCFVDDECSTGICCLGACSQCCDDTQPCPSPFDCTQTGSDQLLFRPWRCPSPGSKGAPCLANDDCEAKSCRGSDTLQLCEDGRRCEDDGDCPPDFWGEATQCLAVGVDGGVCD
jgi:hypothetical protein